MNHAAPSILTKVDRLIYAIRDDDVETFKKLGVPFEEYINLSFDFGMNILNFAIDQERMSIINYLAIVTADNPELQKKLATNRFDKNEIQAIHQAVTVGSKQILDCIIENFKADLDAKTAVGLTPLHCAA